MADKEFESERYNSLFGLWCHHNATQLQWPAVVMGAALLVISTIVPAHLSGVLDYTGWGVWNQESSLAITAGIPLALTGLGIITLLYTMGRARRIMTGIESEIVRIDKANEAEKDFHKLNHLSGFSGPKLIRGYLAFFLALPLTFFGFSFILGLVGGTVAFGFILFVWALLERAVRRGA